MKLIQILDENGKYKADDLADIKEQEIRKMYRLMILTRLWNDKAMSLQRQGRLGTLASVRGQEASNVGMALALQAGDWFVPAFREYGSLFTLGISMKNQYRYWGGDERGNYIPEDKRVLPTCITVGAHLCHAAGMAVAAKTRGEKSMILSSSGDGSTSQGDFHESLNLAGLWKLPVVFVIQNNHWAISVPVEKQTATKTLAEKAAAYAIDGLRVDGNDVFAVYKTVKERADIARNEFKPALIELVTYRMGDHTTADDATRYRKPDLLKTWEKRDPIERVKKYLMKELDWSEEKDKELVEECTKEVEQAVKEYENSDMPEPETMFDYMYNEMPWHLKEQLEEVKELTQAGGKK
ncbi:pyruvate dehydrogenase (acetyl-transferring) E1 component subunit alpha [candidate division KSB1 bacterium]|nr:pyruvate dehydrogenase (acetyl-transferring) E1 component subunit alpha [candidate division KSB1 bacterium]